MSIPIRKLYPIRVKTFIFTRCVIDGFAFAATFYGVAWSIKNEGIMKIIDNAAMLVIPGTMSTGLGQPLFGGGLIISLIFAGIAAFPANPWLISRGKGHALINGITNTTHHQVQWSTVARSATPSVELPNHSIDLDTAPSPPRQSRLNR